MAIGNFVEWVLFTKVSLRFVLDAIIEDKPTSDSPSGKRELVISIMYHYTISTAKFFLIYRFHLNFDIKTLQKNLYFCCENAS